MIKVKFWFLDNPSRQYWIVDDREITLSENKAKPFKLFDALGHSERLARLDPSIRTELVEIE